MKTVLIIGAGPSGLTAALELLRKSKDYDVTVLEEESVVGGISKTINYKGNRMDMGGHRLFSKNADVNLWWERLLPMENQNNKPETTDAVMLKRNRVSRILFDSKFYDYPVSLGIKTLRNLGFVNTMKVGFSYLHSVFHKLPETNLENFYINRFGRKLYEQFFEYYTENLWGRHPRDIDASWGAQRVKGLSITAVVKDVLEKIFRKKERQVETSLIESFKYPKFGPGQLWEITAAQIEELGGRIITDAKVVKLSQEGGRIKSLTCIIDGAESVIPGDLFISSMPLKDLIAGLNDVPENVSRIAAGLPYRDYMTLGVLVRKLKLKNETGIKTAGNIVPDCWIYVQDRNVKMGRIQIFNNWSPYMVQDVEHTVWIGLEYFVNEGDWMWNMTEKEFTDFAVSEMVEIGLVDNSDDVIDSHLERVRKAYPAYFDTYNNIDVLHSWLDKIPNLYCVGRNGQHRYNNIDHSMMTSFEAVRNILSGTPDKTNIWNVNTEAEYHEQNK